MKKWLVALGVLALLGVVGLVTLIPQTRVRGASLDLSAVNELRNYSVVFQSDEAVPWTVWPLVNPGDQRFNNPTWKGIDEAYLKIMNPVTEKFYQLKRAGKVTPRLQAQFDRFNGYMGSVHEYMLIQNGVETDYIVDDVFDAEGNFVKAGTTFRSQELVQTVARLKLSSAEMLQFMGDLKIISELP